jgi:hypothetical protein
MPSRFARRFSRRCAIRSKLAQLLLFKEFIEQMKRTHS